MSMIKARHNLINSVLELEVFSSEFGYLRISTLLRQYKYNKNGLFFTFWWVLITKVPNMFTSQWEIWFPWGPNQPHLLFCRPCSIHHLHFGRTGEWLNTAILASMHSHLYRFSSFSTPFQQQSPGGGFKDVQLSSHFQFASLVMLFETGTLYMMMINIRHVSQCFFKLSVELSGNIK